jgi:uncharacterized MAPEG superfamily protein
MYELLFPYSATVLAMGATAGLVLVQMLVADVAAIRAGHVPGAPVTADHGDFLFRATRAHANTNESVAAFALLAIFGIFSAATASWLNGLAWCYVVGRAGHMLCYYFDLRLARSAFFTVSLVALVGMLVVGIAAWLR